MCDQQSLRSACAYEQSDQSLCWFLKYFMSVKLLPENHLEFLSLRGGFAGSSESTLVKIPHVGNHVLRLIWLPNLNVSTECGWNFLYNQDSASILLLYCHFYAPKGTLGAYSNRTVRTSVPLHVRCISPILFEVGIPNLVCGCILGWQSVAYHILVTMTLTSDLVFIVITMSFRPSRLVSEAYFLYSLR